MRKIYVEKGKTIPIGRLGENEATAVIFDVSSWNIPGGTFTVLHRKHGSENAYPVAVEADGTTVTWTVRSADLTEEGYGEAEMVCTHDETIMKSELYTTRTGKVLDGTAEPPEPWEDWVSSVLKAGADATTAKTQAQASATAAMSYRNTAGQYKDQAKAYRDDALGAALQAEDARARAAVARDDADNSAGNAALAAQSAHNDANRAKASADQAEAAKVNTYTKPEIDEKIRQATPADYEAVKEKLNENTDDLAEHEEELRTHSAEIVSLTQNKVGYSEVVGNQLIMYSDITKEHLLATLDLPSGGGVEDVQINGASVVADGVAKIPLASSSTAGAMKVYNGYGAVVSSSDQYLKGAVRTVQQFQSNTVGDLIISKGTLNNVLSTPSIMPALTDTEKAAARERLGVFRDYEQITDIITLTSPQNNVQLNTLETDYSMFREFIAAIFIPKDDSQGAVTSAIAFSHSSNVYGYSYFWYPQGGTSAISLQYDRNVIIKATVLGAAIYSQMYADNYKSIAYPIDMFGAVATMNGDLFNKGSADYVDRIKTTAYFSVKFANSALVFPTGTKICIYAK